MTVPSKKNERKKNIGLNRPSLPRLPLLSNEQEQLLRALEENRKNSPPPLSPCAEQTKKDIEIYYRTAEVGDAAAIRHTQGGLLRYVITDVEGRNPKLGRIYIRGAGAFYMKSGANCFHPKGQTSLVVPTENVKEWATMNPRGKFDVSVYAETEA